MPRVIPAEAVARAHGAAAGNARNLLRSYHRALESGSYGSEEIPHDLTEEDREQLEDAIVVLHERYPDLEDEGPADPDEEAAEQVSRGAAGVKRTRGAPERARGRASAPKKKAAPSRRGSGRRRAAAGGFLAGNVIGRQRALRETGIAGVTDTTTSLVLRWVGLLIGLSLAYLLLTNATSASPGKSAIELFATGLATAAQTMILPLDPLRAHPQLSQAQARRTAKQSGQGPRKLTAADRKTLQHLGAKAAARGVPQLQPTG